MAFILSSCVKNPSTESRVADANDRGSQDDCFANFRACPQNTLLAAYRQGLLGFHVARLSNRESILKYGLDPKRGGGTDGACALNSSQTNDPEHACNLINNSRGYVHFFKSAAKPGAIGRFYENNCIPYIIFGIRLTGVQNDIVDPDMPGAFKTSQVIQARDLYPFDGVHYMDLYRRFK